MSLIAFIDPYISLLQATQNLYPDLCVNIRFDPSIRKRFFFFGCWGYTEFKDTSEGVVTGDGYSECRYTQKNIVISAHLPVIHSVEIIAHEIAHAVVGIKAGHGPVWKKVFYDLHKEWYRLENEGTK